MKNIRKAAEMALEVMEYNRANGTPNMGAAIEALRQALAQPEQEPFGYFRYDLEWDGWVETEPNNGEPLYTAPPKREWVGLTDEQRHEFVRNYGGDVISKLALVKAIEAKLKEKNT